MLVSIKESYYSTLTVEQIRAFINELASKKIGFGFLKRNAYQVHVDQASFILQRRGGTNSGPTFPRITGRIARDSQVEVELEISPTNLGYLVLACCVIVAATLSISSLTADNMTINGVYRPVEPGERLPWALFSLAVPAFIAYFKVLRPISSAEKWLMHKLQLQKR